MAPRDDIELRGPARLAPPRVSVVRLNRRVLYVAGAVLGVAVIAGLVALRAQGSRLEQDANAPRASQLAARPGDRWFDKIPDREPSVLPTVAATPPAPLAPPRCFAFQLGDLLVPRVGRVRDRATFLGRSSQLPSVPCRPPRRQV